MSPKISPKLRLIVIGVWATVYSTITVPSVEDPNVSLAEVLGWQEYCKDPFG